MLGRIEGKHASGHAAPAGLSERLPRGDLRAWLGSAQPCPRGGRKLLPVYINRTLITANQNGGRLFHRGRVRGPLRTGNWAISEIGVAFFEFG